MYGAENQEAQAHTAYVDARDRARDLRLRSPIDGVVTAVAIQAGLDAPSGDAVTIASSAYEVTADAVESDIGSITVGQPAAITIGAVGADLTGKVSSISPVAGSATNGVVSYAVTITLDDAPQRPARRDVGRCLDHHRLGIERAHHPGGRAARRERRLPREHPATRRPRRRRPAT